MDNMIVKTNERVSFVGRTGSGKTFLARALLSQSQVKRLVVLDPKGTLGTPEWGLTNWDNADPKALEQDTFRLRVRTPLFDDSKYPWDKWLERIYDAGNLTLYIDEAYGVVDGSKPSPALRALVTRGRELGIGVWTATQRPSWIPLILLSEADWFFMFQLRLEEDKRRMQSFLGDYAWAPLRDHNVVVYNDHWEKPRALVKVNIYPMTNKVYHRKGF